MKGKNLRVIFMRLNPDPGGFFEGGIWIRFILEGQFWWRGSLSSWLRLPQI